MHRFVDIYNTVLSSNQHYTVPTKVGHKFEGLLRISPKTVKPVQKHIRYLPVFRQVFYALNLRAIKILSRFSTIYSWWINQFYINFRRTFFRASFLIREAIEIFFLNRATYSCVDDPPFSIIHVIRLFLISYYAIHKRMLLTYLVLPLRGRFVVTALAVGCR
ncbi:hypothetical protein C448_05918 [Halococcus morrhuae DSM 1307]|uniref:Uncharacterized protein n=1 Tax=Halococcus morrhuae DSM 1307 TaxID=931277 RepID=M0MQ77_HALMO|nr:hypothetical protein C448_05918 [Halococcus morrhuae DSM 1307]